LPGGTELPGLGKKIVPPNPVRHDSPAKLADKLVSLSKVGHN
jgi:hypothetical protein